MKRTYLSPWILALGLLLATHCATAELRTFTENSLDDIERAHTGKPFLLHLWSLDCASCLKEMRLLSGWLQEHPEVRLVMLSTDGPQMAREVERMLRGNGLDQTEGWLFAEANAPQLRYAIDPRWYGEMPRTYFYDAAHRRTAKSGALTIQHLEAWLRNPQVP